ncbi:MAG: SDR family oxidoreductase [Synergistaceae bacterium]|jgi:NAD(P)-dependent dehydrogenase (short-subunit alcohol dehydrogenase family)|nr:SDR family oxidoreductase [Synergistaceae bacterium]
MGFVKDGKTAFVTNGTDENCAKLCCALAVRGFSVAFTHEADADAASDLASRIESAGVAALPFVVKNFGAVRSEGLRLAEELSVAVVETAERFGGIDALFYFAPPASASAAMLLDLDDEDWDVAMDRGAKGFFLSCKYALPYLISREGSSVTALDARGADEDGEKPGLADLASREALRVVVEDIADELSAYGISTVYKKISGYGWIDELLDCEPEI